MMLSRIPVLVVANNPAEYQAFAEILKGRSAGALVLAEVNDEARVALICPSGDRAGVTGIPMLVLGGHTDPTSVREEILPIPASLSGIMTRLEVLALQDRGTIEPIAYRGWVLHPARSHIVDPVGRNISLTDTETRLLAILFDAKGQELDKDTLLQRVWGYRQGLDTHTLETHIYRLRQKMETNPTSPNFLMTTDNGYRLF